MCLVNSSIHVVLQQCEDSDRQAAYVQTSDTAGLNVYDNVNSSLAFDIKCNEVWEASSCVK